MAFTTRLNAWFNPMSCHRAIFFTLNIGNGWSHIEAMRDIFTGEFGKAGIVWISSAFSTHQEPAKRKLRNTWTVECPKLPNVVPWADSLGYHIECEQTLCSAFHLSDKFHDPLVILSFCLPWLQSRYSASPNNFRWLIFGTDIHGWLSIQSVPH